MKYESVTYLYVCMYVCMYFTWVIMSMTYYNCEALYKLKIQYKTCQLFKSWMLERIYMDLIGLYNNIKHMCTGT